MKRKFLAAAVLGVMVSVTPAGAYAASTETSPLPVNSESDTVPRNPEQASHPCWSTDHRMVHGSVQSHRRGSSAARRSASSV